MLILKRVVVCTFFVFLFSIVSFADPVRITSGIVANQGPFTNSPIKISGNGVSYNIGTANGTRVDTFTNSAFIAQPGSTVSPKINVFSPNGSGSLSQNYIGSATINGVSYFGNFGGAAGVGTMVFTLNSGFSLPTTITQNSLPDGAIVFTIQVPFTMTGTISGQSCTQTTPCTPIPLTNVYGSGLATLSYGGLRGNYHLASYSFEFAATPEPTPEPATLFLFGAGIAGLAGYAAKRRRSKKDKQS